MAEEVTRVVENVDRLFSEIVVNGESHTSDRYVPPEPAQSNSVSTNQEEEENQESTSTSEQIVEGGYVEAVLLNSTLHNLKDSPLTQAVNTMGLDLEGLHGEVDDIEDLIPNQATPSNQLADKAFVNSSISTNTANFLGTYTSMAQIEAIQNPTNNDYAYLETTDSVGNNKFDRYKYSSSDSQWHYEYTLNNSSFTAEQWATINSGLTQTSVENLVDSEITEALTSPTISQPIFDFCHPVGETYTQYPEQLNPMSLYNRNGIQSTWVVIDYGGAFFRAEGGNAMTFDDNVRAITAISGNTITIASHGASVGTVIFDFAIENGVVRNESRVVTAVSGDILTLNSQFTSTILRNVLIGQSSQNRYHNHTHSHTHNMEHTHGYYTCSTYGEASSGPYPQVGNTHRNTPNYYSTTWGSSTNNTGGASDTNTSYNGDSVNQEARSENFTYRIWRRTA